MIHRVKNAMYIKVLPVLEAPWLPPPATERIPVIVQVNMAFECCAGRFHGQLLLGKH